MTAAQVIARAMPTVRILWAALTASNVMMAVVSFVVVPRTLHPPPDTQVVVMAVAALAAAIASFVMPRRANARVVSEVARPEPSPGGALGAARFVDPVKAARQAMARGQTAFILGMALSESISCDGLVVHMIGAPHALSLPFFVVGTALCAVRFPTPESIVGPFERLHGASFAASGPPSY